MRPSTIVRAYWRQWAAIQKSRGSSSETRGIPFVRSGRFSPVAQITMIHGTNQVAGADPNAILSAVQQLLAPRPMASVRPQVGDCRARIRIARLFVGEARAGWLGK
jgi:hypothetical protein